MKRREKESIESLFPAVLSAACIENVHFLLIKVQLSCLALAGSQKQA